ncbi:hypothetical protein PVAP13_6NG079300 [Panicum virgatum]|uniref:Cytochrome P450 n=1 Tax=Panicum virgatum TaxID=38727 RepID=A0A8T0QVL6_PANVG|nr:hypothetical protein PVAP13_6NG079300 [Panicum virgatum]
MLLRIGEVPTLVVSSREAARAVMKTHDTVFATRPLRPTMRALTNGGRGDHHGALRGPLAPAPPDHHHQAPQHAPHPLLPRHPRGGGRRHAASVRRGGGVPRPPRGHARAAVRAHHGHHDARRDGRPLQGPRGLAAGARPLHRALCRVQHARPLAVLSDRGPAQRRDCIEIRDTSFRILDGIIEEHLERMRNGGGGEVEDLLDVLLKVQQDRELATPLDRDVIKSVITDIFAGSETTAPTLEWAMAELVQNPKVMERATAEVRNAFAAHGSVREDKLEEAKLRYLPLVIQETLRLHTPLPFLIPQVGQEPCRVLGYDVPQGITVMVNAWALDRDKRYWPGDPDAFRPERFEAAAGGSAADFKGADFELLPFGSGRRMCPGMGFCLHKGTSSRPLCGAVHATVVASARVLRRGNAVAYGIVGMDATML